MDELTRNCRCGMKGMAKRGESKTNGVIASYWFFFFGIFMLVILRAVVIIIPTR